ncbi:MAG: glycine betaine ABC transporter substrate-binding protein, partial [Desulfovibrionales bacterium]
MVATGVEGAVTDPLKMGFVANDIAIVANKDFLSNNPAAAKFFEVIQLPLPDIAAQNIKMFEGEDRQKDIERHVDEWIAKNTSTWDAWLNDAKLAAVEAE